jgi:hypothetical protein
LIKIKKIGWFVLILLLVPFGYSLSQYLDLSGNNSTIEEYVQQSEDNWNRSIIYVFYNNQECGRCAQAMEMIYDIYQNDYSDEFSYFEINYEVSGEGEFQYDYQLSQPLSIVLLRINDGLARGYYKIDNPQFWVEDPNFFRDRIVSAINNFLVE